MVTAKKVRLMLLIPAIVAILILSGCLDKTPNSSKQKNAEQIKK